MNIHSNYSYLSHQQKKFNTAFKFFWPICGPSQIFLLIFSKMSKKLWMKSFNRCSVSFSAISLLRCHQIQCSPFFTSHLYSSKSISYSSFLIFEFSFIQRFYLTCNWRNKHKHTHTHTHNDWEQAHALFPLARRSEILVIIIIQLVI